MKTIFRASGRDVRLPANTDLQSAPRYTVLSLFAGAGGMDLGFVRAGFQIGCAIELDQSACASYRDNLGDHVLQADINTIAFGDLSANVDVVIGGPPCQGFSVGGQMRADDPRNECISRFFDCIDEVSPKAFVCENVPALAVFEKWRAVRNRLIERAEVNHVLVLVVVNAADYGVAQNRERMFLIGIRKDIFSNTTAVLSEQLLAGLRQHERSPATVGDIVRALGPAGSARNRRTCGAKITFLKKPVLRSSVYAGMIFNGAGRPQRVDGPANTLPASMGGNRTPIVDEEEIFAGAESFVEAYHRHLLGGGRPSRKVVPRRLRRLTIDECIALQGFPPGYHFAGSQTAIYRQIGNAVPPPLAAAIAASVRQILDECFGAQQLQRAA